MKVDFRPMQIGNNRFDAAILIESDTDMISLTDLCLQLNESLGIFSKDNTTNLMYASIVPKTLTEDDSKIQAIVEIRVDVPNPKG